MGRLGTVRKGSRLVSSTFCGALRFNATKLHNIVNTNAGHVGVCAINRTSRKLTTCVGSVARGNDVTVDCSDHVGSSMFTGVSTRVFTTGNLGICVCDRLVPAPVLSFTIEHLGYSTNIVVATDRGPTGCGNCGTCNTSNARLKPSTTSCILSVVRDISTFSNIGMVSFSRTFGTNGVRCVSRRVVGRFLRGIGTRRIRGSLSLSGLGIVCSPLGNANGGPIHRVLEHINIGGIAIMPRRRLPSNGFPATPCPGPRVHRTFRYTLGLTRDVPTSLLLTASPSYSHINVTIGRGNRCVLVANGSINTILLCCVLSHGARGGALARGPVTIGAVMADRLYRGVTSSFNYGLVGILANFGFVNRRVSVLRGGGRRGHFVLNCRRDCNCLSNTCYHSGSTIITSVLVYRVTSCCGSRGGALVSILGRVCSGCKCCCYDRADFAYRKRDNLTGVGSVVRSLHRGPPGSVGNTSIVGVGSCGASVSCSVATGGRRGVSLPSSGILTCFLDSNDDLVIEPSNARPGVGLCVNTISRAGRGTATGHDTLATTNAGLLKFWVGPPGLNNFSCYVLVCVIVWLGVVRGVGV